MTRPPDKMNVPGGTLSSTTLGRKMLTRLEGVTLVSVQLPDLAELEVVGLLTVEAAEDVGVKPATTGRSPEPGDSTVVESAVVELRTRARLALEAMEVKLGPCDVAEQFTSTQVRPVPLENRSPERERLSPILTSPATARLPSAIREMADFRSELLCKVVSSQSGYTPFYRFSAGAGTFPKYRNAPGLA